MLTDNFEIFKRVTYIDFENNGKNFLLSTSPYLDIVLGDHCNARCKFCISSLVHDKIRSDFDKQKEGIDYAINKLGVREVLLLGGEPTVYPHLFHYIDYLDKKPLNKICMTTNGHKLASDRDFCHKVMSSGLTHINISLMNLDTEKQKEINGTPNSLSMANLREIRFISQLYPDVNIRIQANVWKGNLDSVDEMIKFYLAVSPFCDSIKFSPLLKTDSFSTVNEVTEFNRTNILTDMAYDRLWHSFEDAFSTSPIVRNKETFGFVEYSMVMLDVPVILNYNQHGKLREKVIKENKINNLKMLPTGDLSLSWNREEKDFFIDTKGPKVQEVFNVRATQSVL